MTPREQFRSHRLSQGRFQRLSGCRGVSRRLRPLALAATLGVLAVTLSGCSWSEVVGMGWPEGITPQAHVNFRINITYARTSDTEFTKTISRYTIFPVTPLGMCYDGSQKLESTYKSLGDKVIFLYDPSGFASQGHIWVAVKDKAHPDTWLAVDSYYGAMADPEYYNAPYSFTDFKYLDSINPKWRLA